MKKLLLLLTTLISSVSFAQKVTIDFSQADEEWGIGAANNSTATTLGVTADTTVSNGAYTLNLKVASGGYIYYNTTLGLIIFRGNGTGIELPAFDFAVGTIVVKNSNGSASNGVETNIQVDGENISTTATGSRQDNTFEIPEAHQTIGTVYTVANISSSTNAQITSIEVYEAGNEVGDATESNVYEAALTDSQGSWTVEDVVLVNDSISVWSQSTQYGMRASGYVSGTNYASDSYLVSPAIVLQEGSVLTFDHAQKYATDAASELLLYIREKDATEWTQLTIPTYSDGSSWDYVSSGDIDLSAYSGKTIQLGFRYTSTTESGATWEIKNVKVTNAAAEEEEAALIDPTNTAGTAYTVAEACAIIDNRSNYDLTQSVYVKGIISSITEVSTSYGNATYTIVDQTGDETTLTVYRGYFLENSKFTSEDQIQDGDEVIVYGALTLYNSTTYELGSGNYIYSLNGETTVDEEEEELTDPTNTAETAYTVAEALAMIDSTEPAYDLTQSVYVKGIISSITEVSATYGNATYTIVDQTGDETTLTIYRGLYLENTKFTDESQIEVGDEVVVYGALTLYYSTYEMTTGNYIYSLNGTTTGIGSVSAAAADGSDLAYDLTGRVAGKNQKGIVIINGRKVVR